MAKIEISTIRQAAASLVELNEGYILYQHQDFEDFEFEIIKIPTLSFIVSAIFDDKRVTHLVIFISISSCISSSCLALLKKSSSLFLSLNISLSLSLKTKNKQTSYLHNPFK